MAIGDIHKKIGRNKQNCIYVPHNQTILHTLNILSLT